MRDVPFILVPTATWGGGQTLEALAGELGLLEGQVQFELDSFEAAKEFILEGIGIGLLPCWVTLPEEQSGRIVRVQIRGQGSKVLGAHTLYTSYVKGRQSDHSLQAVLEEIRQNFKTLREL